MTGALKCTLHAHTTYCDGKSTPEEMVLAAMEAGCHTLGFSGHSHLCLNGKDEDWCMTHEGEREYRADVRALSEKYGDRIDIMLGLELDSFSEAPSDAYDYIIGSVHYVKTPNVYIPVDAAPELLERQVGEEYGGDFIAFARDYFENVADVYKKTKCDMIGHFDLITKFNERYNFFDETDKKYREYAYDALDSLLPENIPFEVNTGAISRGWRTSPYPSDLILRRIGEKGGAVILSSDTHSRDSILCGYEEAYERIVSLGVKNICKVKNKKITL